MSQGYIRYVTRSLFHFSRRHSGELNFVMNVPSVLVAYSFFEKKPSINIDYCIENVDGQLAVIK